MVEKIKRMKITKENYLFDGDQTLVALTAEVHQALTAAMAAHAWPFLERLASYDGGNPTTNIVHFAATDPANDAVPAEGAIKTLREFMPVISPA